MSTYLTLWEWPSFCCTVIVAVKIWIYGIALGLLWGCQSSPEPPRLSQVTEAEVRQWANWQEKREEKPEGIIAFYAAAPEGWSEQVEFVKCTSDEKERWTKLLVAWKREKKPIGSRPTPASWNFRLYVGGRLFLSRVAEDEGDLESAYRYGVEALDLSYEGIAQAESIDDVQMLDMIVASARRLGELSRNSMSTQEQRKTAAQKVGWHSQTLPFLLHNLVGYDFDVRGIATLTNLMNSEQIHIGGSVADRKSALEKEAFDVGDLVYLLEDGSHFGSGFVDSIEKMYSFADTKSKDRLFRTAVFEQLLGPYIDSISRGYETKLYMDASLARIGTEWFLAEHARGPSSMRELNLAMDTQVTDPLGSGYKVESGQNRLICVPDELDGEVPKFFEAMRDGVEF